VTTVSGNGTGVVTLIGSTANLNPALASLVYRGSLNYSGADTLQITANDGSLSASPDSVAINVVSAAQQAADLQAQVSALQTAGVLNQGRANSLIVKLNLRGNSGDVGKVQAFLNEVAGYLSVPIGSGNGVAAAFTRTTVGWIPNQSAARQERTRVDHLDRAASVLGPLGRLSPTSSFSFFSKRKKRPSKLSQKSAMRSTCACSCCRHARADSG
jgi:hypothetical protein